MNEEIREIEQLFLAMADKTRLQLLYLLRDGEVSVNALSDALDTSQPKVSRHLAYLRAMNVVTTRRDGKSIYYKLAIPTSAFGASVMEDTIDWLDSFSGSPRTIKRPVAERRRTQTVAEPVIRSSRDDEKFDNVFVETTRPEDDEREMEIYLL